MQEKKQKKNIGEIIDKKYFTKEELQTHDREKDKRIKELEQKVQELQELDNKRAFRLYSVLYEQLEKEDCENVASRIDYLTGKDYSDICELYKTAKNIKQHDRELVEKVLEKTKTFVRENTYICGGNATREDIITSSSYNQALRDVLDFLGALQKELEK